MEKTHADNHHGRMDRLQRRMMESFDELWNDFVDPTEAFHDVDGTHWGVLGSAAGRGAAAGLPFANEQQLADIRAACRTLAVTNEFAINGHENRISYIVGSGHAYRVVPKLNASLPPERIVEVQAVLDEFLRINRWHTRQEEIVRRRDRDGEAFLWFFVGADGTTRVRFVEPDQVATPPEKADTAGAGFGVRVDPNDAETVLGYWIDGGWVEAEEIQHRKTNVDANVKRGLPLFYPVRKNLRRAEKLLRNMSVVAEIQSAIAIIRKHSSGTRDSIQQFVQDGADASVGNTASGQTSHFRRYAPGTILDAFAGTEYEFPVAAIDASRYVTVLQAELRAIAARLVMPEFMLSSDASNASYASTMVAEGPAVRMFERLQHEMIEDDLEVMWRVVRSAARSGRIRDEALGQLDIQAVPPSLSVRDRLEEARADQILVRTGAMSVHTMAMRHGLDPDLERKLRGEEG